MKAINPATEELISDYPDHDPKEVKRRLEQAADAFASWRDFTFAERGGLMRRAADLLRENRDRFALLMTAEMGKPLSGSESEVDKCSWVCDFYAEHAERFLAEQTVATDASRSFVCYQPLGPVLAVMPWNFPLWQVFRFLAPGLMAGNVGLLKHASNVPGTALAIEALFHEAGFPEGVMTTLLVPSSRTAELIRHPAVQAVTLTGSDRAGREVAAEAGRCLKKTVLELGGSDPFIVLDDADPAEAARQAAKARTINSGQSCIAAKRFIVDEAVADRFEEELVRRMEELKVGDPMDRATDVGPMAREDLLGDLDDQVQRTVQAGARLATGGHRLPGKGWFYAPAVLLGVRPGMAAFDEETFGPVAAVVRARDTAHAALLANRSQFGLGASVWTGDAARGEDLAAAIEAGSVFVNGAVKSDPRLPFGGIKSSGYGRELAEVGIREFVNIKTVWVK
ncbi:MAG: succinate-semialdehyde dehydrogenase / glutarate-semialdehyde dehydrogenase [Acidobacteriota bacterium]|jgi:succinate-semialdehyde dehydrogenase/glutarate-semialdehyde dehydrogenase|nr:succinate-semialdehyde dehydrogenase / glutarate-semialdehyde dehydrogenase [Acidobacteriota bacterium]